MAIRYLSDIRAETEKLYTQSLSLIDIFKSLSYNKISTQSSTQSLVKLFADSVNLNLNCKEAEHFYEVIFSLYSIEDKAKHLMSALLQMSDDKSDLKFGETKAKLESFTQFVANKKLELLSKLREIVHPLLSDQYLQLLDKVILHLCTIIDAKEIRQPIISCDHQRIIAQIPIKQIRAMDDYQLTASIYVNIIWSFQSGQFALDLDYEVKSSSLFDQECLIKSEASLLKQLKRLLLSEGFYYPSAENSFTSSEKYDIINKSKMIAEISSKAELKTKAEKDAFIDSALDVNENAIVIEVPFGMIITNKL